MKKISKRKGLATWQLKSPLFKNERLNYSIRRSKMQI